MDSYTKQASARFLSRFSIGMDIIDVNSWLMDGVDINYINDRGRTALMYASYIHPDRTFDNILKLDPLLDIQDLDGKLADCS